MTSPLIRHMKGLAKEDTTADGLLYNDWDAVNPFQVKCVEHLAHTIQLEEEAYMIKHPEVIAMTELLASEAIKHNVRKNVKELAGYFFTQPVAVLDKKIREFLKSPPEGPYTMAEQRDVEFDNNLESELLKTILEFNPLKLHAPPSPEPETPNTISSSFLSVISSGTTQPTPEPSPIPEPTIFEIMYKIVVNCMEKATMLKVTDDMIKYDMAYVELMKIVENAMEIPVIAIREDISNLLAGAMEMFEYILDQKAKIAADIAWDRRMRKKLKRSLRRQDNFKGYETPPTPRSGLPSSHASYKVPPPRPCKCHPQWTYNRYPKDRFGIYLPRPEQYETTSVTVSPGISATRVSDLDNN